MEELGVRPTMPIVNMVGNVFKKLDMLDKYQKLNRKYPPPKWEYRYIKGKRIKVRAKYLGTTDDDSEISAPDKEDDSDLMDHDDNSAISFGECNDVDNMHGKF